MTTTEAPPVTAPKPVRKSYQSAKDSKRDAVMIVEIDGTEFQTHPGRVPGSVLIDFQGLLATNDPEAMWNFFRSVFVTPEEYQAFHDFIQDPVREVDINLLFSIIQDLIEFSSGSPTAPFSS